MVRPMKISAQDPAIETMVTNTRFGSDNMLRRISLEYKDPEDAFAFFDPLKVGGAESCIRILAGCFTRRLHAR